MPEIPANGYFPLLGEVRDQQARQRIIAQGTPIRDRQTGKITFMNRAARRRQGIKLVREPWHGK